MVSKENQFYSNGLLVTVSWNDGSITYSILPKDGKRNGHNVKSFTLRVLFLLITIKKTNIYNVYDMFKPRVICEYMNINCFIQRSQKGNQKRQQHGNRRGFPNVCGYNFLFFRSRFVLGRINRSPTTPSCFKLKDICAGIGFLTDWYNNLKTGGCGNGLSIEIETDL
jgi:hypothetical protein